MECLVSERLGNGEFAAIHRLPAAAVVSAGTWQTSQPDAGEQRFAFLAAAVAACRASRAGLWSRRMKRAK